MGNIALKKQFDERSRKSLARIQDIIEGSLRDSLTRTALDEENAYGTKLEMTTDINEFVPSCKIEIIAFKKQFCEWSRNSLARIQDVIERNQRDSLTRISEDSEIDWQSIHMGPLNMNPTTLKLIASDNKSTKEEITDFTKLELTTDINELRFSNVKPITEKIEDLADFGVTTTSKKLVDSNVKATKEGTDELIDLPYTEAITTFMKMSASIVKPIEEVITAFSDSEAITSKNPLHIPSNAKPTKNKTSGLADSFVRKRKKERFNIFPNEISITKKTADAVTCTPVIDGRLKKRALPSYAGSILHLLLICTSSLANVQGTNNTEVKLKTYPVEFGGNVELKCSVKTNATPFFMAWKKIPDGNTVAFGNTPSKPLKYEVRIDSDPGIIQYYLLIKNFSLSDVNCLYKCYTNFFSNSKRLQLNEDSYVAVPNKMTVKKKLQFRHGNLVGRLQLQPVYPRPKCEAFWEMKNVTDNLSVMISNDSLLFTMRISLLIPSNICNGEMFVICAVGKYGHNVTYSERLDNCFDAIKTTKNYMQLVICVGILVTVLIPFGFCVKWLRGESPQIKKCQIDENFTLETESLE